MTPEREQRTREAIAEFAAATGCTTEQAAAGFEALAATIRETGWRLRIPPPAFTCPCCGRTSHNPRDYAEGYCGACHWYTADPDPAIRNQHHPQDCPARAQAAPGHGAPSPG